MTAAARLAAWLGGLAGPKRWAAAAALGALAAAALPPVYALPALLIAFPGLLWLIEGTARPRRAFIDGWWFGLGHFVAGLYWIAHSLLVEGDRFAWLIPFAVLGIPAVLAFYTGAAAAAARCAPGGWPRLAVFAACWTLAEWLRGHLLTGFPWNLLGTVWTVADAPIQFAAAAGVYGLGLLTAFAAAAPAALAWRGTVRLGAPALAAALIAGLWAGGAWRLAGPAAADVPGVRLRIVQPNIPQRLKWLPAWRDRHLARYVRLSTQAADGITHLVWPESAVPFLAAEDEARRRIMAGTVPPGGLLLTGAIRRSYSPTDRMRLHNSVMAIDRAARILAVYDKFHLVPFGEYVTLRAILGFAKVTQGRTDFAPGPGPRVLTLPGLPPVGPLVCYEAIFPDEIIGDGPRPRWLLNVTNDAWFGVSAGPHQHFAAARLRAVEQGLPLVRAANTGISGVVDAHGRVRATLGLDREGVLDSPLPAPLKNPPPYAVLGDAPTLVIIALVVLVFGWRNKIAIITSDL